MPKDSLARSLWRRASSLAFSRGLPSKRAERSSARRRAGAGPAIFVAFAVLIVCTAGARADTRIALVIGNSQYAHEPTLKNPSNDAEDMARALGDIGFRIIKGRDLDKASLDSKLREFMEASDGADVALLFYAGHGVQVDGKNYLVPTDAKLERRTALDFELVDVERLIVQMESVAKVNLIFLDACRDNPLASHLSGPSGRSAASGRGLSPLSTTGAGTLIALSTSPGEVARDGEGRNSPFTAALLREIRTPGLEIKTLLTHVRAEVAAVTKDEQIPWDTESLRSDVYLVPAPKKIEPVASPIEEPRVPATPCDVQIDVAAAPDAVLAKDVDSGLQACARALAEHPGERRFVELMRAAEEQRAFKNAMRSPDLESSDAYLLLYPAGRFVAQVRAHLARLTPAPPPVAERPNAVDRREMTKALESELRRVGCYSGPIDEAWGSEAAEALHAFARKAGLTLDAGGAGEEALVAVRSRADGFCHATPARLQKTPVARKPPKPVVAQRPPIVEKPPAPRKPKVLSEPAKANSVHGGCLELNGQQYCK